MRERIGPKHRKGNSGGSGKNENLDKLVKLVFKLLYFVAGKNNI